MSAPMASNGAITPSTRVESDMRLHGRWLLLMPSRIVCKDAQETGRYESKLCIL